MGVKCTVFKGLMDQRHISNKSKCHEKIYILCLKKKNYNKGLKAWNVPRSVQAKSLFIGIGHH